MGYNTNFHGSFNLSRSVTVAELRTIELLNSAEVKGFPHNGGYLDWEISADGTKLKHNGSEKSYDYVDSLRWLCDNLFAKWGVQVNGEVKWAGEESGDMGVIIIKDNVVTTKRAKIIYE